MEGEIKKREVIDINDLIALAAKELVGKYENHWVHKRVPGPDTELSSGEFVRLLMLEKDGTISEGELQWLKRLRAELVEETNEIINGILAKYLQTRRPTEMQRGEWIGSILRKFQELICI